MSEESREETKKAQGEQDASGLGAFVLALREALLGLPGGAGAADSEDVRAQVTRLQGLAKRLEVHEKDLESARQKLLGPWQKMLDEAMPKLKKRLDSGGLKDVFEFQGLLEEVRRRLAEPPTATLPEALQAQEMTRLQAEVVRLLDARRKSEIEAPPLKAKIADLQAQVQAARDQLERAARDASEAKAERDQAVRDAEKARKEAAEAEWRKAYHEASAQSLESRHFQEQFQIWRGKVAQLEQELENARQTALLSAQEAALVREDLGRSVHALAQADGERRRLAESEAKARQEAGGFEASAAAAKRDFEGASEREAALKAEVNDARERLAAARAEADHEHGQRLEASEALRRLEEQLTSGTRSRADMDARLRQAVHDATARGVELEKAKIRLTILEETNAQRTVEVESLARRLAEETETGKRLADSLERVERAHRTLQASARQAEESTVLQTARLAAERDRVAQGLEESLARLGALEQEAGFARAAERSGLDRAAEAETRGSQLDALRRRLEGELAQAREELSDQKADTERARRELAQAHDALTASEAAQRQSLLLSETLNGEVTALQNQLTGVQEGLSEARREIRDAAKREGLKGSSAHVLERELERIKVELALRDTLLVQERRERALLEDELARDRVRLASDARRIFELAKAAEQREAATQAGERPESPLPHAPAAPAMGVDGLDTALRTLLGTLEATLGVVRAAADAATSSRPILQNVQGELNVLQDQVRSLVELFRVPLPTNARNVWPVVEAVLKGWAPSLQARNIQIAYRVAPNLPPCAVHPERLTVVVHQLLRNAHAAMPEGGKLEFELSQADDDVRLRIADSGPGFPDDVLADPQRPFRKSLPGHLGIGLALAARFAKTVGGELRIQNRPEGGAVVELDLPRFVPPEKRR